MSGLSNVSKTNSIEDLNLDTGAGIGLLTQNSSQASNPSTFNPSVGLGNKYTEAVNGGDWDAMGNIPTLGVNIGKKNTYYTVSTSGDTKLLKNNHHWQIGEKAFYDGTTWHVGIPKYVIDTRGGIQMQHDFNTTAQTAIKILPQVSPVLGELDYCIPGPNSNWTENSNDTKDAFSNYVDSIYTKDATRMVCDKLNLCITKHTEHFSILSIAPPIQYQSYFSSLPDLWAKITKSELFNTVIKPNEEILPEVTDAEKEYIKKATDNLWSEYTQKINSVYGPNQSGMQSELLTDNVGEVSPNPKYLKMATTGLVMTRNMVQQIDDLDTSTKQYQDDIAVNNANIYKLNVIKDKINAIVSVAQIRRANRRNTDHLSKLPQICLDNEKITWVDNDILKY